MPVNHAFRLLAGAWFFCMLPAVELGLDRIDPALVRQQIRNSADGGIDIAFPDAQQIEHGSAYGGVVTTLLGLSLLGDRLEFDLQPLPGSHEWSLLQFQALSGSNEPQVVLDTYDALFRSLNWRGYLAAEQMHVDRNLINDACHFQFVLIGVEAMHGYARARDGTWMPVSAQAQRVMVEVVCQLRQGMLFDPRVKLLSLQGQAQDPVRLALYQAERPFRLHSPAIELHFDGLGRLQDMQTHPLVTSASASPHDFPGPSLPLQRGVPLQPLTDADLAPTGGQ